MAEIERTAVEVPRSEPTRVGFLPIKTNAFDRGFIGLVCFIAIHLFWMRFVEFAIPLWVATILSLVLAVLIVKRG